MSTPLAIVLLGSLATTALAQVPQSTVPLYFVPSAPARIEGMLREIPRAQGPSLQLAIRLATAAVDACKAKGGKVSVLVSDSLAVPVVMLSGDGAGERSQLITYTKAHTVIAYRLSSTEVAAKARTDPKLANELAQNPNIGVARGGAFPLLVDGELIGVLAVSGMTGEDDACAKEAMAKVPLR
jgi:uncharacterized protein GlcG (DUF336 family)